MGYGISQNFYPQQNVQPQQVPGGYNMQQGQQYNMQQQQQYQQQPQQLQQQQQQQQQQWQQQQQLQQQPQQQWQQQQQLQQQPQQGNLYVIPPGSLQPEVFAGGSNSGGGSREKKIHFETKYNHFKPEHSANTCLKQKKIVLNVNTAGFGNKLLSILSVGVMATLMNRVVELDWSAYRDYNSLFNVIPQQPMLELFR